MTVMTQTSADVLNELRQQLVLLRVGLEQYRDDNPPEAGTLDVPVWELMGAMECIQAIEHMVDSLTHSLPRFPVMFHGKSRQRLLICVKAALEKAVA